MSGGKSQCRCKCGNISISGIKLPKGAFPNIPNPEKKHCESCIQIFKVNNRVNINDNSKVLTKNRSKGCMDITCLNCNTTLRFFHNKNPTYVGITRQHRNSNTEQLNPRNIQLKKIQPSYSFDIKEKFNLCINPEPIVQNEKQNIFGEFQEDEDFELMFGNKNTPIVGSFEQNIYQPYSEEAFHAFRSNGLPKSCA